MARLSILVAVYNVKKKLLTKCLSSLKNQTYQDIEIIIVDDGSGSECAGICDQYSKSDERFTVIHKSNEGLSIARNTAFLNATSDWIMFVDGDDWLEDTVCERALPYLNSEVDICLFGIYRNTNNNETKFPMTFYREELYKGEENKILRDMVLEPDQYISTAYAKIFRGSFLRENGLLHDSELKSGIEGIEFCYRVFDKAESIRICGFYGYHYMYNDSSLSSSPSESSNKLIILGLDKLERYIIENDNGRQSLEKLYRRVCYVILATATRGYFNPRNHYTYRQRIAKMTEFMKESIVKRSLRYREKENAEFPKQKLLDMISRERYMWVYCYSLLSYIYNRVK